MNLNQRRILLMSAFLTAWAGIVVCRLFQIQVLKHTEYVSRAAKQQERTLTLNPVRGSILDRAGRVLAESVVAESFYADPQAISDPKAAARALARIPAIGANERELEKRLRGKGEFAWLARQVSPETAQQIKALKLAGIYSLEEHRRSYPKLSLAANVLGYVSLDGEGLAGAEHSLDDYVKGKAGKVTLLRDAKRGMYMVGGKGANAPVDGQHVVLTIDSVIQFLAERALQRAVDQYHATSGSVVVLDARDNSILALASNPTFDPNRFKDFSANAWRNRPVQDLYEPGSTFKIVAASGGLEEGLVTPSQMVDCADGSIEIANVRIREHGGNRYGVIPFEEVLVHSSNVGIIRVGLSLGPRRLFNYVRKFGFGTRTGVELPGEAQGLVRPTERWSMLSNAVISMGQEIGITPLQLADAFSTIANGGVRRPLHIVDRVVDDEGHVVFATPTAAGQRVVSEKTAAVMNEILKAVVARGTGQNAAISEHVVAGKTGTAQKAGRGGYSADKFVASFAGYVPADRPRLVIVAVVDEPRGAQYGGTVAAPIFHEVAEAALRYLRVDPSIPGRELPLPATKLAAFSQNVARAVPAAAKRDAGSRVVPDLRGLDARAAVAAAVRSGFEPVTDGSGVVTEQEPVAGSVGADRKLKLKMRSPWESTR